LEAVSQSPGGGSEEEAADSVGACQAWGGTGNLYEVSCSASKFSQYLLVSCHGSLTLGTSGLQQTPYPCSVLQMVCISKLSIAEIECLKLRGSIQSLQATFSPGDPSRSLIDTENLRCHGQG